MGMLRKICSKYSGISGHEFDDLLQQSFFGLVKAAEHWQPDQDTSFLTYAIIAISGELKRYIDDSGSLIRKPVYKNSLIGRYNSYVNYYRSEHGREPSEREIIQELDISSDQLRTLLLDVLRLDFKSLDAKISEEFEDTIADTVADPVDKYDELENNILSEELAEKLWAAVNKLKKDQKTVIREYYANDKSIADISKEHGWTYKHTRDEHRNALHYLRTRYSRQLLPYAEIYGLGVSRSGVGYFNRTWTSSTEYAALKLLEGSNNENR